MALDTQPGSRAAHSCRALLLTDAGHLRTARGVGRRSTTCDHAVNPRIALDISPRGSSRFPASDLAIRGDRRRDARCFSCVTCGWRRSPSWWLARHLATNLDDAGEWFRRQSAFRGVAAVEGGCSPPPSCSSTPLLVRHGTSQGACVLCGVAHRVHVCRLRVDVHRLTALAASGNSCWPPTSRFRPEREDLAYRDRNVVAGHPPAGARRCLHRRAFAVASGPASSGTNTSLQSAARCRGVRMCVSPSGRDAWRQSFTLHNADPRVAFRALSGALPRCQRQGHHVERHDFIKRIFQPGRSVTLEVNDGLPQFASGESPASSRPEALVPLP